MGSEMCIRDSIETASDIFFSLSVCYTSGNCKVASKRYAGKVSWSKSNLTCLVMSDALPVLPSIPICSILKINSCRIYVVPQLASYVYMLLIGKISPVINNICKFPDVWTPAHSTLQQLLSMCDFQLANRGEDLKYFVRAIMAVSYTHLPSPRDS